MPSPLPQPWTYNNFSIDDGLTQGASKQYGRGMLKGASSIPKRDIAQSVVAHNPGEIRTYSRDAGLHVAFSGHVWAAPAWTEQQLHQNLRALKAAFGQGLGQLCVMPDGSYWLAELEEFQDGIVEGDAYHAEYTATFYAPDPWAYGQATATTLLTNTALSNAGQPANTYAYQFPKPLGNLGSAPSALQIVVTVVSANGAFVLRVTNPDTTPAQVTSMAASPFQNGDVVTFDGPSAQVSLLRGGVTTYSPLPAGVLTLTPGQSQTSGLNLIARSFGGAPHVSIQLSYSARFR